MPKTTLSTIRISDFIGVYNFDSEMEIYFSRALTSRCAAKSADKSVYFQSVSVIQWEIWTTEY